MDECICEIHDREFLCPEHESPWDYFEGVYDDEEGCD